MAVLGPMLWTAAACASAAEPTEDPTPRRTAFWAAVLPERPHGVGPTIGDRRAWDTVAAAPAFKDVVRQAEKLLKRPIPALTDEMYLDFSRTGNRGRCERVLRARWHRAGALVLAECIENRGRFLPAIQQSVLALCGDKTWVMPAHDRDLKNFKGTEITIDLQSSAMAWDLATARWWLGERLSPALRKRIDDELQRRVFAPFAGAVAKNKPRLHWLAGTNNWNAVCLAGVTGAALANIESRPRRAFFAAAAEQYIKNYLHGFTPDGYCSEGLGYWNYGFGRYVMLAETLRQAGGADRMDAANVRRIAWFARRMEITPGVYPAFADCHIGAQPSLQLTAFLSRRYGWGFKETESRGLGLAAGPTTSLFELGLFGFPNSATAMPEARTDPSPPPLRDWFPDAGALICRPAAGNRHALGAAIKGGHNAEHHNHNDVGTFVVALDRSTPLVDPGGEVYTARTFSARRYESNVLNSLGHPVPRVAGRLQETGRQAAARVVKTEFTDAADTLVLDVSAAYNVEGLRKLERTFVFSRAATGRLTVTDAVEFDRPRAFSTALITFDRWKQIDAGRLLVGDGPNAVTVEIAVAGGEAQVRAESIEEDLPDGRVPTRLGIDLTKPVKKAAITMVITPAQ
jgi:hypothetical protein